MSAGGASPSFGGGAGCAFCCGAGFGGGGVGGFGFSKVMSIGFSGGVSGCGRCGGCIAIAHSASATSTCSSTASIIAEGGMRPAWTAGGAEDEMLTTSVTMFPYAPIKAEKRSCCRRNRLSTPRVQGLLRYSRGLREGGGSIGGEADRGEYRHSGCRTGQGLLWRHPRHGCGHGSRLDRHLRDRRQHHATGEHRDRRRVRHARAGSLDRGRRP